MTDIDRRKAGFLSLLALSKGSGAANPANGQRNQLRRVSTPVIWRMLASICHLPQAPPGRLSMELNGRKGAVRCRS